MAGNRAAGWWLALLVGLVALAGLGCVSWAATQVSAADPLGFPVVMTLLVAAGGVGAVVMRPRSQHLLTTTAPAVLAAVVVLPAGWAVLCTAVGFAAAKVIRRQPPRKLAFNTGKEILAATAAAAAAGAVGMVPASVADQPVAATWGSYLAGLCVAALAYAAVDELLPPVAIGLATGTRISQVSRRDLDIRSATRGVDLVVAAAAVALAVVDLRLLVLVPAALVVAYLVYSYRLRLREERRTWRQLATVTDAVGVAGGSGDLTRVLHAAVAGAARLLPPAQVEIEIRAAGRLVRGGPEGVSFDGPASNAPPAADPTAEQPLTTAGGEPIGWLRLRFAHGPAVLADREPLLLHDLAPHVATAVQTTTSYAEAVAAAHRHAHEANHDPLTGLPNRRLLHQHLSDLLSAHPAGWVALLLVDLDHFKEINDTAGHPAGDQVLVEATARLRAGADAALVARLGGDEFAVVLHGPPAAGARQQAQRLLDGLGARPVPLDGVLIHLQASGGLAIATDQLTVAELLRRADLALYQAKRNAHPESVRLAVYQPGMEPATSAQGLGVQLPRAVATDRWHVTFEPVVDLATGGVIAARAAPAWPTHHAGEHPLPPARLLEILQRCGMLSRFVNRMLDQALAAAAGWQGGGFELAVAVNLTPGSIADAGFAALLAAKLEHHRLPPQQLTIELTCTNALRHNPATLQGLAAAHAAGVRIALDGTGTAATSLATLYRLPHIDELHVDGLFVAELAGSPRASALVSSIVEMGRRLALPVIAEGVEQTEQRRLLWELGCTAAQGSLFSTPRSSTELLRMLQRGYDGHPGRLCPPLHDPATVIRMPTRPLPTG